MRAVVCRAYNDPQATSVEEVASPALKPGCVRVRVHVAGVSFANLLVLQGTHQNRAEPPFTPGTEVAGVVIECAPDISHVRVGERVAAGVRSGGYAEEVIVPALTVYRLPDAIDFLQAVHFPTIYATAYAALAWRAHLQTGERVLVLGAAGGSGLAAIEVARCLGGQVLAVAGTDDKLAAARRHGAEVLIDRREGAVSQAVLRATDGRGADVIFDPVGGEAFREAMRCIAPDGRIIPMGFASGEIPNVPANIALVKNITVIGLYWGHYVGWGRVAPVPGTEARVRAAFDELFGWCEQGRLRPETWRSWPLEGFREALAAVAAREVIGRVALTVRTD